MKQLFKIQKLMFLGFVILRTTANCDENSAETIVYRNDNDGTGNYYFKFLTTNDITREERGSVEGAGGHAVVKGSYSFQSAGGQPITVYYIADEKGYRITKTESNLDTDSPPPGIVIEAVAQPGPAVVASLLGK